MNPMIQTVIITAIGSTGVWQLIQLIITKIIESRHKNDPQRDMLLGLGYDRLMSKCEEYIDKGYISVRELADLNKYLYQPYVAMGGNGTAKDLMEKVEKLPNREEE